ncbi:MAG: DUF1552 domain-containing protein, partial [Verrucomicrobiales bacterium]|nr:DUF1552 domain-containing protein [Verrucomicrobiales bacterium]
ESCAADAIPSPKVKRLVCIGSYLGYHRPAFYPEQTGADYAAPELLRPLKELKTDYTVFSGLDHRAGNGHNNWSNFLCGNQVDNWSLDQQVSDQLRTDTRFHSLQLTAGKASRSMNFTKGGVALPMIQRPSVLYQKLFASEEDKARTAYLLESGRSALDQVTGDARRLQNTVSKRDREKLEEFFSSVRDVEKRMERQRAGLNQPVPQIDYKLPGYDPVAPNLMLEAESIMYDLMLLSLETDSTRVVTMFLAGLGQVFTINGETLKAGYHALSHHGNDPEKIKELVMVEKEHMKCLARFLTQLKAKTDENGESLLNSTFVLFGSGMGDASRHSNRDLPTLVAGGGLRCHGQHLSFDPAADSAPLLGDLYISLMQKMGLEVDSFSNATRNLNEAV